MMQVIRMDSEERNLEMGRSRPHALVMPFPAQGHVTPFVKIANLLAQRGIKITFLNTEAIQQRITTASPENCNNQDHIDLVTMPDGLGPPENARTSFGELLDSFAQTAPKYLEELILKINGSGGEKITWLIVDENMGWAVKVAKKLGIRQAVLWPCSAALRTLFVHIPQLIETGVIDAHGTPKEQKLVQISPTMPAINTDHFGWNCIVDLKEQQTVFHYMYSNHQIVKDADWLLCNSFDELEPTEFFLNPYVLPVGPLLSDSHPNGLAGNLWKEDSNCLEWLDQQPASSVIYVAFGSIAMFDERQFHELALGLELSNRPFLWVVRPDSVEGQVAYRDEGFQARVVARGRMVGWAPQQKVLAHPSIACIISHC
ncbi:UDP-glucuronosyl/UDP-glucosyltransferase, partial [Dillenia turbinata]